MIDNAFTHEQVVALLGRVPKAAYCVRVVNEFGEPVVLENEPICFSGEPMPTRYWLVGSYEVKVIGHIESSGGVQQAENDLSPQDIANLHQQYSVERDAKIPRTFEGARPSGGVGGTHKGVKCLHAHYAHWLVAKNDVVGEWVNEQLKIRCESRENYVIIPEAERVWWRGEAQ